MSTDQTFAIFLVVIASAIFTFTLARLFKGPIGQALARRIAGTEPETAPDAGIAELLCQWGESDQVDETNRQPSRPKRIFPVIGVA